jgi:hypothetical protein
MGNDCKQFGPPPARFMGLKKAVAHGELFHTEPPDPHSFRMAPDTLGWMKSWVNARSATG